MHRGAKPLLTRYNPGQTAETELWEDWGRSNRLLFITEIAQRKERPPGRKRAFIFR